MLERRRDNRQQLPERVHRRSAELSVDARVSRVLALQRSAGNHAVASALRPGTLQRLTAAQVKGLTGEAKTKYEAAKTKYDQNFGVGKPLYDWPSLELAGWSYYVSEAETVSELVATIDRLVGAATAWKKREEERAAEPETPAPVVPPPSKAQTTEPKQSKQSKRSKRQPATDIVFGATSYETSQSAVIKPPPPKPTPALALPPKLSYIQRSLDGWNGTDHTGKDGLKLTLEDVQQVVAYVRAKWAARPFKGPGSGDFRGTLQLKISELGQVGNKKATWHLTLSPAVYTALEVPLAGS